MLLTQLFAPQRNEFARHFPLFIMTEISVCSASELIMIISYNAEVHKSKKSKTTSTLFKKVTLLTFDKDFPFVDQTVRKKKAFILKNEQMI